MQRSVTRSAARSAALSATACRCHAALSTWIASSFKDVNERYGHLHGSRVLANFAAVLRAEVRGEDTLGRYGGDEFVLLLPDTNEAAAAELAERVRSTITTTMINLPHDPINASIGVAQWQPGCSVDDTLEAADQALRAAKEAGGGSVIRARVLTAAPQLGSSLRRARASNTTDPHEVCFCGGCGQRPREEPPCVCVRNAGSVCCSARPPRQRRAARTRS